MNKAPMLHEIIKRTLRVPVPSDSRGDGTHATRQLDVALMNVGFKLSRDLFASLSQQPSTVVIPLGQEILVAVKELLGEHVQHNVYFLDFPAHVPDTIDFWWTELLRLFLTGQTHYGRYQHSYQEMLEAHETFIPALKDQVTLLHLGKTLPEEVRELYFLLAESSIPLNDTDLHLLEKVATACLSDPQPENIPMRETKAIINCVRINHNQPLQVDTITDILRLACALSDGDVTLQEVTMFRSFRRPLRRRLLQALDDLLARSPMQLADVHRYQERWKRLGERLHPHEYPQETAAQEVFAVARGEKNVFSFEAKVAVALRDRDHMTALSLLRTKPGLLVRNIDYLLREASEQDRVTFLEVLQSVIGKVSGRVLLSFREHVQNRTMQEQMRVFTNRRGRAWVTGDVREPLNEASITSLMEMLDEELRRRMPHSEQLVIDPEVLGIAIPLSEKNKGSGFAIMPRGSTMHVGDGLLRFFVYWKQTSRRTDYDLSALILNDRFEFETQVSWTNLQAMGGIHSGDLTEAPDGASEFIDLDLHKVRGAYIIPQVNIYAGEKFTEVESCFFGFMLRTGEQRGKPFEAATVRMKSDLRGTGRVALPLVFIRAEFGQWSAKWLHLYLKGHPKFNQIETNRLTTGVLARSVLDHHYLTLDYLLGLMREKAARFSWSTEMADPAVPVTFIGLQAPDELQREHATTYTLSNLHGLIPS